MTAQIWPWADSHPSSGWPWLLNVSTSAPLAKGKDCLQPLVQGKPFKPQYEPQRQLMGQRSGGIILH